MRRAVSLLVAAGVLTILAGTAAAEPTDPSGGGFVAELAPTPAAPPPAVAPEQVGTVETVDTVLGYLGADRSATLHYPGASYVKVHFRQLLLLPGDYVTVADPQREEVRRYEAEPLLGLGGEGTWAMSVTGDTAVVTLHVSQPDLLGVRESVAALGVTVDQVARGYTAGEAPPSAPPAALPAAPPSAPGGGREETICGRNDAQDAVCYQSSHPTIYRNSKAVARLLINGTQMCTAFRVGPTNRMLTNNHCIASSREARSTEVWFNYQCSECGGWAVFRPTKVRADQVLVTDRVLDFTLFTVDDLEKVAQFGFLDLDPRGVYAGEEVYIPQHPAGAPTRVALDSDRDRGGNCAVSNPRANGYGWHTDVSYYCDTQGGSSGSPVLSRDSHKVIALHHFGGCPNSGVRMDLIYPHLSPYL